MRTGFLKYVAIGVLWCVSLGNALEHALPIRYPERSLMLGYAASVMDDIYSGDVDARGEFAFNKRVSLWASTSFRTVSYLYEVSHFEQIHGYLNLQTYGFNASYFGMKYVPAKHFGIGATYRMRSFDGDRDEIFHGLETNFLLFYPFSERLLLSGSLDLLKSFPRHGFEPGAEWGAVASLVYKPGKWEYESVILYRKRLQESLNLNMERRYQGQKDDYAGVKVRGAISRVFFEEEFPMRFGFAYETNRGNLFGRETGHLIELFIRF